MSCKFGSTVDAVIIPFRFSSPSSAFPLHPRFSLNGLRTEAIRDTGTIPSKMTFSLIQIAEP